MNILTLYYICYVLLAVYMLDSDQEQSYHLSKNLLLLPRILKLIEDMVNDSTPLHIGLKSKPISTPPPNLAVFVTFSLIDYSFKIPYNLP